jgi:hypothetical protein
MTGMSSAQRDAEARAASAPTTADPSAVTFDQFAKTYIERGPQERAKTSWKDDEYLLTAVRKELRRIDLHFHDLGREAGSRWHKGGFQLHEVRDLLGHANVRQTDTYLSAKIAGLQESMKRFDAARGKSVAKTTAIEQRPLGHDDAEEGRKRTITLAFAVTCARSSGG